jgi:hypothetical protein
MCLAPVPLPFELPSPSTQPEPPGCCSVGIGSVTMEVGRGQSSKGLEEARRLDAAAHGMRVRFRQAESPLGAEENPREFLLTRVWRALIF